MSIKRIHSYKLEFSERIHNKVTWEFEKEKAILLIHDMQEYFVEAYIREDNPCKKMICNIQKIKYKCKEQGVPIIYSAQPKGQTDEQRGLLLDFWGRGIPQEGNKEKIIPELMPDEDDIVITKWRYSAFEGTELEEIMRKMNKTQIIIVGIYAHIGCLTTASVASMKNIKPFMVIDATADFSKEKHELAVKYVSQLTGMVVSTDYILKKIEYSNTMIGNS